MRFWLSDSARSRYGAATIEAETLAQWRNGVASLAHRPGERRVRYISADIYGDGESYLLQLGGMRIAATYLGLDGARHASAVWRCIMQGVQRWHVADRQINALASFAAGGLVRPRTPLRLVAAPNHRSTLIEIPPPC